MPRVNVVGRPEELFDLGDAEALRPFAAAGFGIGRWAARGRWPVASSRCAWTIHSLPRAWAAFVTSVPRKASISCTSRDGVAGLPPMVGPGNDNFGITHRHQEVMRRETVPPLGRFESDREAHATAEPRTGVGSLGPDVLVEPGKDRAGPVTAAAPRAGPR